MNKTFRLISDDGQRKYLNRNERRAFFSAVERNCHDVKAMAFCLTLYHTGCRISEALELTGSQVDFTEKAIVFRTLKRRDDTCYRIVPIPMSLVHMLDELVIEKDSFESRVWNFSRPTGYRIIMKFMGKAKISGPRAAPKGLRHGFAVACVSQNVLLPTLQRWMGHSSLETTAVYLSLMGEEDRRQMRKVWKMSE